MKTPRPATTTECPAVFGLTFTSSETITNHAYRIRRFAAIVGAAVQVPRHDGAVMEEDLERGISDLCRDMERLSQEIITILDATDRIGGAR